MLKHGLLTRNVLKWKHGLIELYVELGTFMFVFGAKEPTHSGNEENE
jgi:hypothetical protein